MSASLPTTEYNGKIKKVNVETIRKIIRKES